MSARGADLGPGEVRALVFDAVGTLIHPDPPAAVVYATIGSRFGSRLPPGEIARRFVAAFAQEEALDREQGLQTNEAREWRRWQRIVTQVLDDVADPDRCFRELFAHFGRPAAWQCDPEAAATLAALAERGYRLGIASNYDQRLHSVVAGLPALEPIAYLIISSEVGWRKPAAEFFAALCGSTHLPAEQILFVGDDPDNDYEGALRAGLRAVLLDRQGKMGSAPPARIGRLHDLLDRVR